MTTYRRYYFSHEGEWKQDKGHPYVLAFLERACEERWWFRDPLVGGEAFNLLQFEFTAMGRDQWFAHKRAMGLAVDVYYSMGLDERSVPVPIWEALAPHDNRGRWRVRR